MNRRNWLKLWPVAPVAAPAIAKAVERAAVRPLVVEPPLPVTYTMQALVSTVYRAVSTTTVVRLEQYANGAIHSAALRVQSLKDGTYALFLDGTHGVGTMVVGRSVAEVIEKANRIARAIAARGWSAPGTVIEPVG